jgi:CRP-like cAMP-binding protein
MAMLSNMDLIRRIPLFAKLSPQQAESLAGSVSKRRFRRGTVLVQQGGTSEALFIILTGRARVLMTDGKGREVILANLGPTDHFGEMGLIDGEPPSATVQVETAMDVLILGREEFLQCLSNNFVMAESIMRVLVQRLRAADAKISSLALMGVYARVAQYLMDAAVKDEAGALWIRGKLPRQDIAKQIGASREMVSRVMKDLEDQGFLEVLEGGVVRVHERRLKPR